MSVGSLCQLGKERAPALAVGRVGAEMLVTVDDNSVSPAASQAERGRGETAEWLTLAVAFAACRSLFAGFVITAYSNRHRPRPSWPCPASVRQTVPPNVRQTARGLVLCVSQRHAGRFREAREGCSEGEGWSFHGTAQARQKQRRQCG